jgi:hypothetical protein
MNTNALFRLRVALSTCALIAATIHMMFPDRFIPDAITAGLILLGVLPWLAPLIKSIEVPGLGKLELVVGEVKEKQQLLQEEVNALRFLVSGFVTDWEYTHLERLASDRPCFYERGADEKDRFINEIIRLRDLGLIAKRIDYALYNIPTSGDLKEYVELTARGRTYLTLREQLQEKPLATSDDNRLAVSEE